MLYSIFVLWNFLHLEIQVLWSYYFVMIELNEQKYARYSLKRLMWDSVCVSVVCIWSVFVVNNISNRVFYMKNNLIFDSLSLWKISCETVTRAREEKNKLHQSCDILCLKLWCANIDRWVLIYRWFRYLEFLFRSSASTCLMNFWRVKNTWQFTDLDPKPCVICYYFV